MITEKHIDLFKEIELEPCIIFHCVSSDKAMGAGIAKPLQNKFHIRENWNFEQKWNGEGYAVFTSFDNQVICNLITKEKYWQKPTYKTLETALKCASKELNTNKIVMPKIGCGLDKLDWNKVKPMIESIFANYNIVVCYL